MGAFAYYPASPASIRDAARQTGDSGKAAHALVPTLAKRHQAAAEEITTDIGQTVHAPMLDAGEITKGALWAACQLEVFADAVDAYNHYASDPKSIDALNDALDEVKDAEAKSKLKHDKLLLDAWLDEIATDCADALNRPPTAVELMTQWDAGNLPVTAKLAWPGLDLQLTKVPAARLLDDLQAPDLDPGLRQEIEQTRPDVWKYLTSDLCRVTYGQVTGPDGRTYDVQMPAETRADDYSVPHQTTSGQFLMDSDDGEWRTLYAEQFNTRAADAAKPTIPLAGANPVLGGWQAYGGFDQSRYLTVSNGSAYLTDDAEPLDPAHKGGLVDTSTKGYDLPPPRTDSSVYGNPPYNVPPGSTAPVPRHADWGTGGGSTTPVSNKGITIANTGVSLALGAAQAAGTTLQQEANAHYRVETVLQENADGERRAVIIMYQAVEVGNDLKIEHYYGQLNPDGSISRIR